MAKEDYKPNSHKYNEAQESREVEPEMRKKPTVRERTTVGQRFKDAFFAESFQSVVDYIVWDVIVPTVKELVVQSIETAMFGRSERSSRSYERSYNTSRTNYRRQSQGNKTSTVKTRSVRNFSTERFEFETRYDAEDVLYQMNEQCRKYDGVCPVSSFYNFIDYERPDDWTHDRWGWSWNALDRARIIRKSNGAFVISICEPDTYID